MYRKIEFRFWDIKEKVMMDWITVRQTAFNRGDMHLCYDMMGTNPNFIKMQFTGLQDKNSKDIFESDIIKWKDKTAVVKWGDDAGGFIIEWAYSKNQHHELLTCDIACECEILGNQFDNPEFKVI